MDKIEFMVGRNRQPIYKGCCVCGDVLVFSPGMGLITCTKCGRRYDIIEVSAKEVKPNTAPAKRTRAKKVGPSERKQKNEASNN